MSTASAPVTPALVSIRFRLQYPDVETFIAKYAVNISEGGMFIASMDAPPVGTVVRFELSIAGGLSILHGEGEVVWTALFDPQSPMAPCGMSVRFLRMDADGQALIRRVLAYKAAHGEQFLQAAPDPYASIAYRPQPPSLSPPPPVPAKAAPEPAASEPAAVEPTPPSATTAKPGAQASQSTPQSRVTPNTSAASPSPSPVDNELAGLLTPRPRTDSEVTPNLASQRLAELLDRRLRPSRS
ncbi:MAG: TIGR02266 family protein [Myxococcales bacterium]|nr:TIGR02266 family protein [Myxococcales bacterium]